LFHGHDRTEAEQVGLNHENGGLKSIILRPTRSAFKPINVLARSATTGETGCSPATHAKSGKLVYPSALAIIYA